MAKEKNSLSIEAPEIEISEVKANRYHDFMDADAGKLIITNQRLIFVATVFNIDHSETEIQLDDIQEITTFSLFGFVPRGILIKTHQGLEHKFVLGKRDEIIKLIKSHLPKA